MCKDEMRKQSSADAPGIGKPISRKCTLARVQQLRMACLKACPVSFSLRLVLPLRMPWAVSQRPRVFSLALNSTQRADVGYHEPLPRPQCLDQTSQALYLLNFCSDPPSPV